jgi:hypothetical protein
MWAVGRRCLTLVAAATPGISSALSPEASESLPDKESREPVFGRVFISFQLEE